jgi:glutathione reductase (NADPH)
VESEKVLEWFTARHLAEPVYAFKTVVEDDTDRILGAHPVA